MILRGAVAWHARTNARTNERFTGTALAGRTLNTVTARLALSRGRNSRLHDQELVGATPRGSTVRPGVV